VPRVIAISVVRETEAGADRVVLAARCEVTGRRFTMTLRTRGARVLVACLAAAAAPADPKRRDDFDTDFRLTGELDP